MMYLQDVAVEEIVRSVEDMAEGNMVRTDIRTNKLYSKCYQLFL